MENKANIYTEDNFFSDIDKIKEINKKKDLKYMTLTYGCQMNSHDTEQISWILELMGYSETFHEEEADFIIFNTCAIRENAELKVYGKVGSLKALKETNKDLKIAICGCMMQLEEVRTEIINKYHQVDLIFGTNNIHRLPKLMLETIKSGKTVVDIVEDTSNIVEGLENIREHDYKAYVNIMYGCNNFCTYCVVPYTRGREKSREPEDIINEIKGLAKSGYKEIMLLGQNVNSYGKSLSKNYSFKDLLTEINEIDGIERIRFMTSHPKDISDDLIKAFGELDKLSKHLHLPVQSGSNDVLDRMNRRYTVEEYLEKVGKIREVCPDIALSTDIIIGFPGETEEDFLGTLKLIETVKYDFVYNFIYSIRPGTKAGLMKDQVDYKVKHERFERINKEINKISLEKNRAYVGRVVKVLIEEVSKNKDDMYTGRTDDFKLVHVPGNDSLIGKIVDVEIKDASTFSLEGEVIY